MKPKKILHISANQFPPLTISHNTKKIWIELAKGFDEYHIIARSKDNKFNYSQEGNIHLHLVPKLGNRERSFLFSSFYIFYLIPKYKITHLLAQSSILGGVTAALARKIFKIPLLVEIHSDKYFKYFNNVENKASYVFFAKLSRFTFLNATKIRSLSSKMTSLLESNNIYTKTVEISNRVDLNLFSPPKYDYSIAKPIQIISVGRFVEQKGYDIAINCILSLIDQYDIKLSLIGGGALYDKFETMKKSCDNIKLIKWIDQKKLIPLLRDSDIYIQPSKPFYGEAMPRTIVEAMALGLPIISTNIAAIPGVLKDGENAILIKPNSIKELSNAIIRLLEDNKLRKRIGINGYKDACLKYEWSNSFDRYRNELQEMIY